MPTRVRYTQAEMRATFPSFQPLATQVSYPWMRIRSIADASAPGPCKAPHNSIVQDKYQHIFHCGGPLAHKTHKPFSLCRQWHLQAAPSDAAALAIFRSVHLPNLPPPPRMVCQVTLIAQHLPTPVLHLPAPGATPTWLPPKCPMLEIVHIEGACMNWLVWVTA
jgi:hypothetical protein